MFRLSTVMCLFACLLTDNAYSQEEREQDTRKTYQVTLTEFRLESGHDPEASSQDIIRAFQDRQNNDNVSLVETLRLTLQANLECTVQYGRRASVVTGVVNNPRVGVQRTMKTMEVGTLAQVSVIPKNDKMILELSYSASRFDEQRQDDQRPDVLTSNFTTSVPVELGKPTLVGGTDSDIASYLIVYVR